MLVQVFCSSLSGSCKNLYDDIQSQVWVQVFCSSLSGSCKNLYDDTQSQVWVQVCFVPHCQVAVEPI